MRYDVTLRIEYRYDQASDHARSLLHLTPPTLPGRQEVIAGLLSIEPTPQERREGQDFFGNRATLVSFHKPIQELTLTLKAQVSRRMPPEPMDLSQDRAGLAREIEAHRSVAPDAPHHFLGPSPRVSPSTAITRFGEAQLSPSMSVLQITRAIGQALHREMSFDAEATDVLTSPGEAFHNRRGVCQDFAHVMIACLRGLGIPAGYVSGFLRTSPPPGQPRLEGADAMHAWVRAWCGSELGWVEYDPTNDILVGDDHIVVAYGRDYADVSPIKGTLRSAGGHDSTHSVDVVPVDA
ncbi:transglutaminase family protein [Litorisediminicola beolgyonensis]|uniref:Transglutaminase domain-containing protein n=1 Tax=Litorisediminicola beolgyonensis TaxID=1173614 RepID=A0ABW3ZHA3_9RHOB